MQPVADCYEIYFDQALNAIVMKWTGYATSNQFRTGTLLMLDLLKKHNCNSVLADIREMTLIGLEDQKWLEHIFLPAAIQSGFQRIAITTPRSYFNKVAVKAVSDKIDQQKLKVSFFDSIGDAERYLRKR